MHSLSTDVASQLGRQVPRGPIGPADPSYVLVVAIAPCNVAHKILHFILDLVSLCQTVAHDEHEYAKERECIELSIPVYRHCVQCNVKTLHTLI